MKKDDEGNSDINQDTPEVQTSPASVQADAIVKKDVLGSNQVSQDSHITYIYGHTRKFIL